MKNGAVEDRAKAAFRKKVHEMIRADARRARQLRAAGDTERATLFQREHDTACARWGLPLSYGMK